MALCVNEWTPNAVEPEVLATFERSTDEESFLILVNPSREKVNIYKFDLTEEPYSDSVQPSLLYEDDYL